MQTLLNRVHSRNEHILVVCRILVEFILCKMGSIKEFLESSTIHGLQYIATTRKIVKLLWILVIVAGFSGAGVLINQSFQAWDESPVKTTIETLPITEITLPKVTVCPPKKRKK